MDNDEDGYRLIHDLTYRRARLIDTSADWQDEEFSNAQKCSAIKANLMCSDLDDGYDYAHWLLLDIDYPVEVYKSSSGNNHVILPARLDKEAMLEILEVLAKHKVVQQGFYRSAKEKGFASLRPPGVKKNNPEDNRGLNANGGIESEEEYERARRAYRDRMTAPLNF